MRLVAFAGGAAAGLESRNTVGQVGGGGHCLNLMVLPGRLRWSSHLWGAQQSIRGGRRFASRSAKTQRTTVRLHDGRRRRLRRGQVASATAVDRPTGLSQALDPHGCGQTGGRPAREEEGGGQLFLQPLTVPAPQCTRGQLNALPALPDVTAFQVPRWKVSITVLQELKLCWPSSPALERTMQVVLSVPRLPRATR